MDSKVLIILISATGLFTERPSGLEDELISLTASYVNEAVLPKKFITFEILNETQQMVSDVQAAIKGTVSWFISTFEDLNILYF